MFWIATAHAFTLDPPVQVGDRMMGLAAAGDMVVLTGPQDRGFNQDLVVLTSADRGLTFTTDVVVSDLFRTPDLWCFVQPGNGNPVALSADGMHRVVAQVFQLEDWRVPEIGTYTRVQWGALGLWRDDGAGWSAAHALDAMTDLCDGRGRRCMHLDSAEDLAVSDDGDVAWTTYAATEGLPRWVGANRLWLGRSVRGVPAALPIDLSTTFSIPEQGGWRSRVATDETGDQVFVSFDVAYRGQLAASTDGGATWITHTALGIGGDVAVARDSGEVFWALWSFGGQGAEVHVRSSVDGGQTFGAPTRVRAPLSDGEYLRFAASRDGRTLAMAYMAARGVELQVSEDGGATWAALWIDVYSYRQFELAMSDDGDTIYVFAYDGDAWLVRANR
ncbi:MAG: exo-alpha-sialidase [Alphaproteobacteria bacterium]|nr:exo-alpha-sialidase [Alphaproteobacteria bacterium]MCB9697751.1 exo-alpha-sialidase [Alphaproteobacteria bacterium]